MGHPEVMWSTVSSCCLHNRHLLSVSSFKILFLKWFVLIAWSWAATTVLSVSPLMSPDFSQQYDCSKSTTFLSSYVPNVRAYSSLAIFLLFVLLCCPSLVSLCTSVLRHLAVCNTAELMLCWCVLTACISASFFLPNYSTNFVISTAWAASNCTRPLPPLFSGHIQWSKTVCKYLYCEQSNCLNLVLCTLLCTQK
jgi:hypothetical protein